MVLAVLQFDLHIHDAQSLKDKRRVVASIKARLHQDHLAAVAEVAHQDTLNLARMALAIIGSDARYLAQTLDRITTKIRELAAPEAELGSAHRQLIHDDQLSAMADASPEDPRTAPLPDDITNDLLARGTDALEHPDR
ncbi:MAG TPA: DUF503 domain-containing protein [Phycisphaerales bacterium]|nr:DUF503 domain-containing protein [Phycisphaerales bacterium]